VQSIDLAGKLATFESHWQPIALGQFDGHDLMAGKA